MNPKNRMMELGFPQDQIRAIRDRLSDEKLISLFEQLDAMPESQFPFASRFYSLALKAMGDLPGTSSAQEKITADAFERQDADRRREIRLILDAEGPSSTQKLHKAIEKRAIVEMKHAEKLIGRILFLEGLPVVSELKKISKLYQINPSGEP